MKVVHRDHLYTESGLPNVLILEAEFRVCPKCGEEERVLPRIAQLHRVIAEAVAQKVARLTGAEIRFLRKHLGWSGEDFAAVMGVTPSTVSRWENEHESMGATAERLLRLMALRGKPVTEYPNEELKKVAQEAPAPARLRVSSRKSGWKAEESTF
jgi:putative zinc finger/helix-turn-helix YgiT family protein